MGQNEKRKNISGLQNGQLGDYKSGQVLGITNCSKRDYK